MPNTNFQTIFQMGQAINDMVKQATGRDVVKEIEMGQVTVAQNHLAVEKSASGAVAEFITLDAVPLQIIADINPVQNFNGFDYPWAGGAGKNKLKFDTESFAVMGTGITCTYTEDGVITISGRATSTVYIGWVFPIKAGTYIINGGYNSSNFSMCIRDSSTSAVLFDSRVTGAGETQFTVPQNYAQVSFSITVTNGTNMGTGHEIKPMIRESSVSDSSFEPYSNICPITGWTATRITVSPSDDPEEGTVYSITYATENNPVYGGTLTINKDGTGELLITWANIASYDGEELPGVWISDRDVYEEGTTPTTGAQVVYELATPLEPITLEASVIESLIGANYVSANTGNVTVNYTDIIDGGDN